MIRENFLQFLQNLELEFKNRFEVKISFFILFLFLFNMRNKLKLKHDLLTPLFTLLSPFFRNELTEFRLEKSKTKQKFLQHYNYVAEYSLPSFESLPPFVKFAIAYQGNPFEIQQQFKKLSLKEKNEIFTLLEYYYELEYCIVELTNILYFIPAMWFLFFFL